MTVWKCVPAALLSLNLAWAGECALPTQATERAERPIESQRVVLPGTQKLEFGLGSGAETFAHSNGMLLVKYADGAMLGHRMLAESELRGDGAYQLSPSDFIRLIFTDAVDAASGQDRQDAQAHRAAIQVGCTAVQRYTIGNADVYGYAQQRANGQHYQALFVINDDSVHFVDITVSDALAATVISTLRQRD